MLTRADVERLVAADASIRAAGQGSKTYYGAVNDWQGAVMGLRSAILTALCEHVGLPTPAFPDQNMTTKDAA